MRQSLNEFSPDLNEFERSSSVKQLGLNKIRLSEKELTIIFQ